MKPSIAAIICAAGSSNRMGGKKKEYLPFPGNNSLTVLGSAVNAFISCAKIEIIVISVSKGDEEAARAVLPVDLSQDKIIFTTGGPSRRASVYNALLRLKEFEPSHVLIHDGARPWIKRPLIEQVIEGVLIHGAVIPVLPLLETPKELGSTGFIKTHLRRQALCTAQTPQGFSYQEILKAHEKAAEKEKLEGFEYTDDAEVWGEFIGQVAVIPGDPENKKITFPEDLKC